MMPTDDPSLTAFLDLDAPGEPAFVFDGTAISRAELSGARMLIMQSSFRSTDFAAILSGIEKAPCPGLRGWQW
jgi:hypothetical protein